MTSPRTYIAIDLKSFYASIECVERSLDPLDTHLVVADKTRTEKTICLAVSPSLKEYGIGGRARLFQVTNKVCEINKRRKHEAPRRTFHGKSFSAKELAKDSGLAFDFIIAIPRMALYIEYSKRIYDIYLKYFAPENIHVYSIDEVFVDITTYLSLYNQTPKQLITTIIQDIYYTTGITATGGIGTNLYLCKVAMDIVAKHAKPNNDGVRIAELDEINYRKLLWNHKPITDFWRIGKGIVSRLMQYGIDTMGKIARCSIQNEDLLYNLFGSNAELIIDHAWGWEPCTIEDIKKYKPDTNSISSGQVLPAPYGHKEARTILIEMIANAVLTLVSKNKVSNQIVLSIGYDIKSLASSVATDKKSINHIVVNLQSHSSSIAVITNSVLKLYDKNINPKLYIRRLTISFNNLVERNNLIENTASTHSPQATLFGQFSETENCGSKEERMQEAMLLIKQKFGSNSILIGTNFKKEATAKQRNKQIGGHKA